MELTTTKKQSLATPQIAPSTRQHLNELSKRDYKGKLVTLPKSLTSSEKEAVKALGKELRENLTPVTPAECAAKITSLLVHYWESQVTPQVAMQIQADWFEDLQGHSLETIHAACKEWRSRLRSKPQPGHIREICDDIDQTPNQLLRLMELYNLPTKELQPDTVIDFDPILGDPIELARMLQFAESRGFPFGVKQQVAYLNTGEKPQFAAFMPQRVSEEDKPNTQTREELLATMTPEARAEAVK